MSKILIIAGLAILLGSFVYLNQGNGNTSLLPRFNAWKSKHSKSYTPAEEAYRLAIYAQNIAIIEAHNADSTQTYKMGENQFTDLTDEEFVATYLTYKPAADFVMPNITAEDEVPILGDSADWRGTTPMKNQGSCGSCWAFSAAAAIEALYKVQKGTSLNLSPQQLVDCERTYSQGCNGGYPDKAISYAVKNGITNESAYPYTGAQGTCRTAGGATRPAGVSKIGATAAALQTAIKAYPVSVCVDATNWSKYTSGTFSNCATNINHAVLGVGFDAAGQWIIKNSWGSGWGQSGHITLAAGNTCGVLSNSNKAT